MFRFFSSKFRIEKSKEKTARVVLWREFNIMNCFTLEASFLGYFNEHRITKDFQIDDFKLMGKILGEGLFDYISLNEDESKEKERKLLI